MRGVLKVSAADCDDQEAIAPRGRCTGSNVARNLQHVRASVIRALHEAQPRNTIGRGAFTKLEGNLAVRGTRIQLCQGLAAAWDGEHGA